MTQTEDAIAAREKRTRAAWAKKNPDKALAREHAAAAAEAAEAAEKPAKATKTAKS